MIILHDGKLAELSSDKVKIGEESIPVSKLSDNQGATIGGYSVKTKPGEAEQPSKENEHHGGGGIGGLLGGLVGGAKKAVDGVKGASEVALSGATAGFAGVAVGSIASKLTTAAQGVNTLVSGLNGIQKAMPADKLTQAGLGAAMDAQNLGRQASNWLSSTGNLVKDFPTLPKKVQDQVVDDIKKFAGEGGQLDKTQSALEAFRDFPWESELPQSQIPSATRNPSASATNRPSGTSMSTNTASRQSSDDQTTTQSSVESTQSSSAATTTTARNTTSLEHTKTSSISSASNTTSTSSTSSAEPSPTDAVQYFIRTKEGTSIETFKKFIEELDNSAGKAYTYDPKIIPYQSYMTRLTPAQGSDLVSKHSFILIASPWVFQLSDLESSEKEDYRAYPRQRSDEAYDVRDHVFDEKLSKELDILPESRKEVRAFLPPDPNAPYWKKMISAPPRDDFQASDPPYKADDIGGKGTTVYIIDDGFDVGQSVGFP